MVRFAAFLVLGLSMTGCTYRPDWGVPESGDDTIEGPSPLHCSGACVTAAPATFTGPSIFWFGLPDAMPNCPSETPNPGIEGFLDAPSPWYARECLITPTDACSDEGETCAPVPADDFQICIHHTDEVDCRDDYSERRAMLDIESGIEVTVCCLPVAVE